MKQELFSLIEILGIVAASISGVFAAMEKKLDAFGVFIIAFITAMGGGTLRDILIGDVPVVWMRHTNYFLIVLLSASVTILFTNTLYNSHKLLLLFDSIGLGFFTVVGLQKGIAFDLSPGTCIALGTITACFGGVIRDVSLNNIPLIFQKEIYAVACMIGGSIYFGLKDTVINHSYLEAICIVAIVCIRIIAVRYNLGLPISYKNDKILKT